jgi:hypothetical protein
MNEENVNDAIATRSVDQQQACSALMSLKDFQAEMAKLNGWAQHGCSDGGCQIEKPKGMHTNGGCRCNPRKFSEYLLWLACEVEKHGRYHRWLNVKDQATLTRPAINTQDSDLK